MGMEDDERVGLSVTQSSHILGWDVDSSAGAAAVVEGAGAAAAAAVVVSAEASFWTSSWASLSGALVASSGSVLVMVAVVGFVSTS